MSLKNLDDWSRWSKVTDRGITKLFARKTLEVVGRWCGRRSGKGKEGGGGGGRREHITGDGEKRDWKLEKLERERGKQTETDGDR